ncbi:mitochondrial ribosomal protein L24 [Lycorma delicatula]|uniref:mitochondrial ribosomal protein L24 n=1 Tax=Lycorma delicatula TaxID=130591 RepID=UPI003F517C76
MRITTALRIRFKEVSEITKKYGNFPESYIKRRMLQIEYKTPRGFPQYLPKTLGRKDYYFGEFRPWSQRFKEDNVIGRRRPKVFIEPKKDWSFFKGDRVEILEGKDKGKQGHVVQVIAERNWVIVEGLNCKLECTGDSKDFPGYYYQNEKPLVVDTQVALIDPSDLQPVTVEWRYTEDGEHVRVSKRTGRIIPIPPQAEETIDFKSKKTYVESETKDTKEKELLEVTFNPALQTFEMEIMKEMGIKEDRIPKPTYWY